MLALPLEGIVGLLKEISRRGDTTVAVISGRPIGDLQTLLSPWDGLMVGSHGFEKRFPGGGVEVRMPDRLQLDGLKPPMSWPSGRASGKSA